MCELFLSLENEKNIKIITDIYHQLYLKLSQPNSMRHAKKWISFQMAQELELIISENGPSNSVLK